MAEEKYAIFIVEGGLGKCIASTAIVDVIKNNHPDRKIIIVSSWPETYLNHPSVERVYRYGMTPYFYKDYIHNKDSIIFKGEPYFMSEHLHKRRHMILNWCDMFKLKYSNENPRLAFNGREIALVATKYRRNKPILLLQTSGGALDNKREYCWTRDLPPHQALQIANSLRDRFHIIQVSKPAGIKLPDVEVLPEISKRELMLLVAASDKRILIDSCLQHAAAALGLPSTVCWIGTSSSTFGYSIHKNIEPVAKKDMDHLCDSFIFDYSFDGLEHEYPYSTSDLFDVKAIVDSVLN